MTQTFGRRQAGLLLPGQALPASKPKPVHFEGVEGESERKPWEHSPVSEGSGQGLRVSAKPVLGLRWASGIIDLVLMSVIWIAMIMMSVGFEVAAGNTGAGGPPIGLWAALFGSGLLYGTIMDWKYGGTVGKLLTGTRVVDVDGDYLSFGRSLGRNAGKILSGLVPFYISYLMVFWTRDRQSLHDLMSGTYVYKASDILEDGYGEVFA